jgi:hypothetical protein
MTILPSRLAALAIPMLLLAGCASDTIDDKWITAEVSHGWGAGKMFRVLQYDPEVQPCIVIRSVDPQNESAVLDEHDLCTLRAGAESIDLTDAASVSYRDLRWEDLYFRVDAEYTPKEGTGTRRFSCMIDDLESTPSLRCRKAA